jgi:hypothetical protein
VRNNFNLRGIVLDSGSSSAVADKAGVMSCFIVVAFGCEKEMAIQVSGVVVFGLQLRAMLDVSE